MVGSESTCLKSTEEVFCYVCSTLPPDYIVRIPDGETGVRSNFIYWQLALFPAAVHPKFGAKLPSEPKQAELDAKGADLKPIDTGYDEAAIKSYAAFTKLKSEGIIPPTTKFQVSIPSFVGTIVCLEPAYRAALEPAYEDRIWRALANIQAEISAHDLAIQIDVAPDIGMIEEVIWITPYWDSGRFNGVERLLRVIGKIKSDVDLGFHFCYGDMDHEHYMEPNDTGTMAKLTSAVLEHSTHPVSWIHMPVPKDREDIEYFKPLTKPDLGATKLFLRLVHLHDEEGTE